ncbi:MAG: hypothetical protein GY953_10335 [bacterium]|nr:hypothetical protein [bacterium]
MDDTWGEFWETLIAWWVAVLLAAFLLQGLWFGVGSFLIERSAEIQPKWEAASGRLGVPWLLAILIGWAWGTRRALSAKREGAS